MHLIETYAASCGLSISKPYIYEQFFPIPFPKFVLFHAGGGQQPKLYEYYTEVATLLRPYLVKHGYEMIQIGSKDDLQVLGPTDLRGATTKHQSAYLIRQASLLIGNDSCNIHIASGLDTPLVGLYGSTSPKNHGAYFGTRSKQVMIEADRKGNKPSFSVDENPKTINNIKPEQVVKAALNLLKISDDITRESLFIGPQYNSVIFEVIMDNVIRPDFFPGAVLNARMDYLFNEDILGKNLSIRSYCVVTNSPINIDILKFYRQNVMLVVYDITKDYSVDFIQNLLAAGIPYRLITSLEGKELDDAKLTFFDFGIIAKKMKFEQGSLSSPEKLSKTTKYKSNRFLLSDNKVYTGKGQWKKRNPIPDFNNNVSQIDLDDKEFLDEADFYYIFNE